jgi:hypothetical protein
MRSTDTEIDKSEFDMIKDMMNAITISECKEFVKNHTAPFANSTAPEISNISNHIKSHSHSGASFIITLRKCHQFLNDLEAWKELNTKFNDHD